MSATRSGHGFLPADAVEVGDRALSVDLTPEEVRRCVEEVEAFVRSCAAVRWHSLNTKGSVSVRQNRRDPADLCAGAPKVGDRPAQMSERRDPRRALSRPVL